MYTLTCKEKQGNYSLYEKLISFKLFLNLSSNSCHNDLSIRLLHTKSTLFLNVIIQRNVSNKCYRYEKDYWTIKTSICHYIWKREREHTFHPTRKVAASFVSKGIPTNPEIPAVMVHGWNITRIVKVLDLRGVEKLEFFECFQSSWEQLCLSFQKVINSLPIKLNTILNLSLIYTTVASSFA